MNRRTTSIWSMAAALGLAATTGGAAAQDDTQRTPAFFVLARFDTGSYGKGAWDAAAKAVGETYVRSYFSNDDDRVTAQAKADAAKAGFPDNVYYMMALTTGDRDSTAFAGSVEKLKQAFLSDPERRDTKLLLQQPTCAVFQTPPPSNPKLVAPTIVLQMNDLRAQSSCYVAVQHFFTAKPDTAGKRPQAVVADPTFYFAQLAMPPITVLRQARYEKAAFKAGKHEERMSSVYRPGEEIFVYVYLGNVGRQRVGAYRAKFEFRLDVDIRDRAGKSLEKLENLNVYRGDGDIPYPIGADYFTNYATAGIQIREPGEYTIAYTFTDLLRKQDTSSATATFDVTIK